MTTRLYITPLALNTKTMTSHAIPPPPPSLNGGLFTGAPFQEGAPWRNFPATPDVVPLITKNLSSADPPPGAQHQFPGGTRPGNNYQDMPLVRWYSAEHSLLCASCPQQQTQQQQKVARFARFYHLA